MKNEIFEVSEKPNGAPASTSNFWSLADLAIENVPTLASIPPKSERLIDEGLMHFEASQSGFLERHSRGETSHTLQVWWARRPHSAMRALVFASLCSERSPLTAKVMTDLVSSNVGDKESLKAAEAILLKEYGRKPALLDVFGGGGTIPLEGANLGADVSSIDINEMSVFIQRCHLEYSSAERISELSQIIRVHGNAVLERLKQRTEKLFPLRDQKICDGTVAGPITYLWSYSTSCTKCSYRFFLSKRKWLSRKRETAIKLAPSDLGTVQSFEICEAKLSDTLPKEKRTVECPRCGTSVSKITIQKCRDELVSLVLKKDKSGKLFTLPIEGALPVLDDLRRIEEEALLILDATMPTSELPVWSGIVNPALYGIKTHADVLNPRQRAVLLALLAELRIEFDLLSSEVSANEAKFVLGVLSGLSDLLVDWNCRLSMWIPQNEQVGRAFCGPGIPMLWDYAESDPLLRGPANLWSKLDRLVEGCSALSLRRSVVTVELATAQNLPFANESFDAIVTDPPYYDNIYYSILADFFFAWKRLLLKTIEPELFAESISAGGGKHELVASTIRSGSREAAYSDYCTQLAGALREASRVLRPNGVISFVYAHASFAAWRAVIHAFRSTDLLVTSAQPLSIERKARPRAIGSIAVNTCITFVARKSHEEKTVFTREQALTRFRGYVRGGFSKGLELAGWQSDDAAMALFAQGVGLLAGSKGIDGVNDQTMLECFEQEIHSLYPNFKITKRGSL